MDYIKEVRQYKEFLTVDELNIELRRKTGILVKELGKSAQDHPILCAEVGHGKKNILLFGFPHPNEPIGSLSCLQIIDIILKHPQLQKDYKWYIIPCADPDGAKLNEGWFKGRFTIKNYTLHFYRSKKEIQIDWTFPVKYKGYTFNRPPINTQAVQALIDKVKFDVVYPLHNAGFGGAYFFFMKPMSEEYYDKIIGLSKDLGIPLDMGEPEEAFIQVLKKPIYKDFGFKEIYDHFEKQGTPKEKIKDILKHGTTSVDYAISKNPEAFGIIGEIPYIYDKRIADNAQTDTPRRERLAKMFDSDLKIVDLMERGLNHKDVNMSSVFYGALDDLVPGFKEYVQKERARLHEKEFDRMATVAESFASEVTFPFYRALWLGMLRRLILESKQTLATKSLLNETETTIDRYIDLIENNSDYRVLPIKNMIQLQLGCLFISLEYLKSTS